MIRRALSLLLDLAALVVLAAICGLVALAGCVAPGPGEPILVEAIVGAPAPCPEGSPSCPVHSWVQISETRCERCGEPLASLEVR